MQTTFLSLLLYFTLFFSYSSYGFPLKEKDNFTRKYAITKAGITVGESIHHMVCSYKTKSTIKCELNSKTSPSSMVSFFVNKHVEDTSSFVIHFGKNGNEFLWESFQENRYENDKIYTKHIFHKDNLITYTEKHLTWPYSKNVIGPLAITYAIQFYLEHNQNNLKQLLIQGELTQAPINIETIHRETLHYNNEDIDCLVVHWSGAEFDFTSWHIINEHFKVLKVHYKNSLDSKNLILTLENDSDGK